MDTGSNTTMPKTTRSSYACARCYKRKKKCDRGFPSCSQCASAMAQCVGLDRASDAELPRSLVSYLEDLIAKLELERQSMVQTGSGPAQPGPQPAAHENPSPAQPMPSVPGQSEDIAAAYRIAARAAGESAPARCFDQGRPHALPYYRAFFLGAELPFPLAFQVNRVINLPLSPSGAQVTQLPDKIADQLLAVYVERILPQYPLFLKDEVLDMFQRFGMCSETTSSTSPDERFMIHMILAITTLSSRAKDYRKLVSVAESLRRDALSCLNFDRSWSKASATTIRQLVLLAQYGFLLPSSVNLWHVVGDATRIASELGLHVGTPAMSGINEAAKEDRTRLFWTLQAVEKSVAITSHRPFTIASDHINVDFSPLMDDPNFRSEARNQALHSILTQVPYIRLTDRIQTLRIQTEVCAVNIGMRPIPNSYLTHRDWMFAVDARIRVLKDNAATPKWCDFMAWHSILLLHMPCARNPSPGDNSVLAYFDAAMQLINAYWDLVEMGTLDYPWHATHHCYEAGNLILYSLWHYRALIHTHYTASQIFETVHRASSFFILVEKQWPAAKACGTLFDRLRRGALVFFKEEGTPELELSLEARQLKELVFRENADLLYAREEPPTGNDQAMFDTILPEFDIDFAFLDQNTDFLGFFDFSDIPIVDGDLNSFENGNTDEQSNRIDVLDPPEAAGDPGYVIKEPNTDLTVDETELKTVIQKLPVCSRCKTRKIKCDLNMPSCRNCAKTKHDCCYWDHALHQETSRGYIHALYQHAESLVRDIEKTSLAESPHATASISTSKSAIGANSPYNNGIQEPLQNLVIRDVLCLQPHSASATPGPMYFGATSSFSRFASDIGSIPLIPKQDAVSDDMRAPMLYDSLCALVRLGVAADLSQAQAQAMARHYSLSIEIMFPVLGQDLITQTLDDVYNSNSSSVQLDGTTRMRFDMIMAISLALASGQDQRLEVIADTYFDRALSCGLTLDQFVHPTNQSLQMMLLLCLYAWIRPSSLDIWRILRHASRMWLDIVEVHGSNKTESAHADILYQTLYTLETQVAISLGRPRQLPHARPSALQSPDPTSLAAGDLSTMLYNLAKLQDRFLTYLTIANHGPRQQGSAKYSAGGSSLPPWMAGCVHDVRTWGDHWAFRVDELFNESCESDGFDLKLPLKNYGEFQQGEALLLAKLAADRCGQLFVSVDEELDACRRVLHAAQSLIQTNASIALPSESQGLLVLGFAFPLTWNRAHTVFTATVVLLLHLYKNPMAEAEIQQLSEVGLAVLVSLGDSGVGLVKCIKQLQESVLAARG